MLNAGAMDAGFDLLYTHLSMLHLVIGDDLLVAEGGTHMGTPIPASRYLPLLKTKKFSNEFYAVTKDLGIRFGGGSDERVVMQRLCEEVIHHNIGTVIYTSNFFMFEGAKALENVDNFVGVGLDRDYALLNPPHLAQHLGDLYRKHIMLETEFMFFVNFLQKTYPELP